MRFRRMDTNEGKMQSNESNFLFLFLFFCMRKGKVIFFIIFAFVRICHVLFWKAFDCCVLFVVIALSSTEENRSSFEI